MIKTIKLAPKGMNQDLSISKFNSDFSYENKNIRITAREDNSLLSIENERGNTLINLTGGDMPFLLGMCIGYATLNKHIVLFTTLISNGRQIDYIYRIDNLSSYKLLYTGNLNFNKDYPIETLSYYETESVQKVYWVDGLNQPRVINIVADKLASDYTDDSFNFSQNLQLKENIIISKNAESGSIPSGVIQYAITYYNIFGVETNIAYTSDLYYTSNNDRALSPDEDSTNSFKISIDNLDKNFEYLRVYSILRTSQDVTPLVKRVGDYKVSDRVEIVDTGNIGDDVDPTLLFYIGGEELVIGTITSKDNTLFGGNISIKRNPLIDNDVKNLVKSSSLSWDYRPESFISDTATNSNSPIYTYKPLSLNNSSSVAKHFKSAQTYRFAIQAQYKNGKWSEPIYLKDSKCNKELLTEANYNSNGNNIQLYLNQCKINISSALNKKLYDNGYLKIRPLFVLPTLSDREVICQGIATNTIGFKTKRETNSAFAYPDYLTRLSDISSTWSVSDGPFPSSDDFQGAPGGNSANLYNRGHFIFANQEVEACSKLSTRLDNATLENTEYAFIDENILNLWSPDIQYNEDIKNILTESTYCNIVGLSNVSSCAYSQTYINTNNNSENISGKFDKTNYDKVIIKSNRFKQVNPIKFTGFKENKNIFRIWSREVVSKDDTNEVKVINNKFSNKIYSLYNTRFEDSTALTLNIHKPEHISYDTNITTIPFNTDSADNNGTINYSPVVDILTLNATDSDESRRLYPSAIKYKANSHILFSLKEYNSAQSTILPGFDINASTITNPDENPSIDTIKVGFNFGNKPRGFLFSNTDVSFERYNPSEQPATEKDKYGNNNNGYRWKMIINVCLQIDRPDLMTATESLQVKNIILDNVTFTTSNLQMTGLLVPKEINGVYGGSRIGWNKASFTTQSEGVYYATKVFTIDLKEEVDGQDFWIRSTTSPTYFRGDAQIPSRVVDWLDANDNNGSTINKYLSSTGGGSITPGIGDVTYTKPFYRFINKGFIKRMLNPKTYYINDNRNGYTNGTDRINDSEFVLPLIELRRKLNANSLYGGNSEESLLNNQWLPCGDSVTLDGTSPIILYATEGDTYVGRYDCLRIVPINNEQVNSITNVLSFLVESFINCDGRYDRNRYSSDTTTARTANYGLNNSVYSQPNNYFNYRMLDSRLFSNTDYPTQITWTLGKNNGELTDTWTNINLSNIADLDGTYGKITSLNTFNSEIISFQDKGIANILFNTRVQIPTSDNVPIEISNNYKYSGYRYISNQIGCTNKWSINSTKNGIYFIDSINKNINLLNQGIRDLSTSLGFKSWSNNHIKEVDNTLSNGLGTFFTSVDKTNDDIYFNSKEYSLGYSETLNNFTSFYSYEDTPFMFNTLDKFVSIRNGIDKATGLESTKLYIQNEGKYNMYFGEQQESYIHYIVNPDGTYDKTFNNIEFRADCFKGDNYTSYIPDRTIDHIHVWNEFQDTSNIPLIPNKTIFKKFRIWRGAIPRQLRTLNRIRNPWIHLKLSYTPATNEDNKLLLHDLMVNYTV